ncbi:MAG: hypothetical protein HYR94_19560 [Chloroflexi bacterium]|nr:hypothetical protein [Chloroflexota bacterium]
MGHIAGGLGRDAEAQRYYQQALEILVKTGAVPIILDIFLGWATLLSSNKLTDTRREQALELLTLAQHHPAATSETKEKASQLIIYHRQ